MKAENLHHLRLGILFAGLLIFAGGLTSCQSTAPAGDAGYYAPQPSTPIDRATYMQDRIGQITRSNIR